MYYILAEAKNSVLENEQGRNEVFRHISGNLETRMLDGKNTKTRILVLIGEPETEEDKNMPVSTLYKRGG